MHSAHTSHVWHRFGFESNNATEMRPPLVCCACDADLMRGRSRHLGRDWMIRRRGNSEQSRPIESARKCGLRRLGSLLCPSPLKKCHITSTFLPIFHPPHPAKTKGATDRAGNVCCSSPLLPTSVCLPREQDW